MTDKFVHNPFPSILVIKLTSHSKPIPDWSKLPIANSGQRVGLFGGSFNPPHAGHLHVATVALRKLQLDSIWWLVCPKNPLKSDNSLLSLNKRVKLCHELANHPKMKITAFESTIRALYSAETIKNIQMRLPEVNFVWVMGADNLTNLRQWEKWEEIGKSLPFAIVDRPNYSYTALNSIVAHKYSRFRVDEFDASMLPFQSLPSWTFIHASKSELSSTSLRMAGN